MEAFPSGRSHSRHGFRFAFYARMAHAPSAAPLSRFDQQLNRALALAQRGSIADAVGILRPALTAAPHHRRLRNTLGVLLLEQGDAAGAERVLRPLVQAKPDDPTALLNLGNALVACRRADDAVPYLRQAASLEPDAADVWYALGRAFQLSARPAEAIRAYESALARDSSHLAARSSLAAAFGFLDRHGDAEQAARAVLAVAPNDAGTHLNLAVALLSQGRWLEGWREYEWRWESATFAPHRRAWERPLWTGDSLHGRTLLVHSEQGLGDTLQFVRYLPMLRAMGARVVLECQTTLVTLLTQSRLADEVIAAGTPLPAHDLHIPLLSVPDRLGVGSRITIDVASAPYLTTADASPAPRRAPQEPKRVGIVWAGSDTHLNDRHRSIPFAALQPLFEVPGIAWVSVQVGERCADLLSVPDGVVIADLGAALRDFSETAAVLRTLDLVIAVDSAVAHLAGGLGVGCCVLLPRIGLDWRWPASTDVTPWYPTVRCVRQPVVGGWNVVVNALARQLRM